MPHVMRRLIKKITLSLRIQLPGHIAIGNRENQGTIGKANRSKLLHQPKNVNGLGRCSNT